MSEKQYIVIGLGSFGKAVARNLNDMGNDVLAIDKSMEAVQEISEYVTHAVQVDATDEAALKNLGIRNFDVAIIAIGSNIQSSIMATLIAKEAGISHIVAKGNNELHAKVLYKVGVDKVILPEKDMGARVAHNLVSSNILDYIELASDYSIMQIETLNKWNGKTLKDLDFRREYGINIIAIKNKGDINISPAADVALNKDDILVALGQDENLKKLEKIIEKDK
ncbi:MAG: TrkA family potassium uptake protein [Clostridium sp.]|nr:TrkA family potassium uptake protein [Clostridium sp.]